jgi:hypothetical protein
LGRPPLWSLALFGMTSGMRLVKFSSILRPNHGRIRPWQWRMRCIYSKATWCKCSSRDWWRDDSNARCSDRNSRRCVSVDWEIYLGRTCCRRHLWRLVCPKRYTRYRLSSQWTSWTCKCDFNQTRHWPSGSHARRATLIPVRVPWLIIAIYNGVTSFRLVLGMKYL